MRACVLRTERHRGVNATSSSAMVNLVDGGLFAAPPGCARIVKHASGDDILVPALTGIAVLARWLMTAWLARNAGVCIVRPTTDTRRQRRAVVLANGDAQQRVTP